MSREAQSTAADRLGHIEAVLDGRLADRGVDDLLVELLDRVRDTLAIGSGLAAAVVMGRLRSTMRAHSFASRGDPEAALDLIDRHVRHLAPGAMAPLIGTEPPTDDVALLVARRTAEPGSG